MKESLFYVFIHVVSICTYTIMKKGKLENDFNVYMKLATFLGNK